jgi:CBS domain-containing protein
MRCEKVMTRDFVYVGEADSAQRAAAIMREENVGFLPVCDRDVRVIGTLTDRDLAIRICAEGANAAEVTVADVMTREVVACAPEDELARAEQLMAETRKSRVLVTDDTGGLLGIISLTDVVMRDSNRRAAHTLRKIVGREARF